MAWPVWSLRLAGVLSVVAAWLLASAALGQDVFPGPVQTLEFAQQLAQRGTLWPNVLITLWRVLASFGLAMLLGVPLGWWLGRTRWLSSVLEAWLALGLTVPRILILLVAFLVIGLNDRALIVSVMVILLPTVAVQLREGVRALNAGYFEMAQAFRLSPAKAWWSVVAPQLLPTVIGSARVTLSLAWKMVVFGEVFGRSSGVGYMISFYFQQFEMRGILAYGLVMTLVLSAVDLLFVLAGRRAFRWQGSGR